MADRPVRSDDDRSLSLSKGDRSLSLSKGRTTVIIGRGRPALRATRRAIAAGVPTRLIGEGRHKIPVSVIDSPQPGSAQPLPLITGAAAAAYRWSESESMRPGPEPGTGELILVGGGPGSADLLTIRACRALARADLVLADRLAPSDGLADLAPDALIVDVGKTPGHHPVPQHSIETEALAHAAAGAIVVRLKGGDPFVFGRGGEEVAAARAAGIGAQVVPGVTSAVAVPGAAGIPITWREVSRSVTVISGHAPLTDAELSHLVGLRGTIVCLMGLGNLAHMIAGLQRHGMPAATPAAVVERGFDPAQRTTRSTVGQLISDCARRCVASPAVVVIGDVVAAAAAIAEPPGTEPDDEW